ncbi:MAG: 2-oxoacid:acceptor oxidoreductase family protein [Planctomycetes bacterium]|nr:2-oxoacid:acceptor oxidoreductase family protein [Planctomycetota bacterium]
MNKELRFTGFGGQGIILAGYITGKAAAIYADLHATLTQNYGPESRGGASSAQLIISDEPIFYPHITRPDILVAMSQEGYAKYKDEVKPGGIILIDEDLVKDAKPRTDVKTAQVPATRLAEQLGKKMAANIVMLGFATGQTNMLTRKVMEEAIKTSVPPASSELNIQAFDAGFKYKG